MVGTVELLIAMLVLSAIFGPYARTAIWGEKRQGDAAGSRTCGHCEQRIPDVGVFCPICGQKTFGQKST